MIIRTLEDLLVYQRALEAANAVSAILRRREFSKDFDLRDQLGNSSSRVPALIAEGFEQKTDRHFAHYLYIARGSAKETKTHLKIALNRGYLPLEDARRLWVEYDEICAMITGLIQHLEFEDRTHRWRKPRQDWTD